MILQKIQTVHHVQHEHFKPSDVPERSGLKKFTNGQKGSWDVHVELISYA
jgi:hypothetical protein